MKSFMLFPGLLYETVPNGVVLKKTGGIVFINRSITPQESFSRETLIPEALLDNVSGEKTLWLMFDLQEMRYMQQVSYYTGEEDMLRLGFYSGLDADMFARAALKKANIGEKTREAFMHARYIELFGLKDSQYWFAPSLDAMENGKDPSDYDKTVNAVRELRMRTAMKHIGIDEKKYTSETLQYLLDMSSMNLPKDEYSSFVSSMLKAFDIITIEHIGESPAPIYTTLRQIVEGGSITDPFAQSIAEKILDAANFFNPDLTHADAQASRERMEKRMRAVHNKGAGLG
ncbi:MAG: hypothetical protein PHE27_00930 [Alphaproteobacteria bacterium]|nr:hypothetical protein [Alphaproteobacteria bacterium]